MNGNWKQIWVEYLRRWNSASLRGMEKQACGEREQSDGSWQEESARGEPLAAPACCQIFGEPWLSCGFADTPVFSEPRPKKRQEFRPFH
ncbi:uncharacterized protein LMH87_008818 [Akanthomyces muscarius]|uniref:Uncharacterized protein n=1 Tax=Akanthomyces muscarius TaxID=2231603 RepID=A0A9W8UQ15_AKAMU|nr:uncharacterized protein LMH87_008818 [Akanthomyces muscarius]KAJ4158286.1 hypothetical protein LMH87_008818 [Akanthomyces muscarius]